jgi:hypothetical protein
MDKVEKTCSICKCSFRIFTVCSICGRVVCIDCVTSVPIEKDVEWARKHICIECSSRVS